MKTADWYFDYVSPFAYLQSQRLDAFSNVAEIRPIPVLFAGLLDAFGGTGPAELAPKRLWTYRVCQYNADRRGVPFRMPPGHPFSPLRALRLTAALGNAPGVVDAVFKFIWAEGRDPNVEWPALTERLGVANADALVNDDAVKAAVRANTEAAVAAGVFGVPTIVIDGQAFWGVDGTDFALDYLKDPAILDAPEMRRIETLPVAAERKR